MSSEKRQQAIRGVRLQNWMRKEVPLSNGKEPQTSPK